MRKLLVLIGALLCSWIASAQSVTLTNIPALDARGNVVQGGSLYVTWKPFKANDGTLVPGGAKSALIQNGSFTITLVASDNAGWPYNALLMGGAEPTVYLWKIPAAGGVTSISQLIQPASNTTSTVTLSGASATVVSVLGSPAAGNCAGTWDAHGNLVPAGAPCSTGGGGGLSAPGTTTIGNIPQYNNATGTALSVGLGLVTSVGSPGSDSNVATEKSVRSVFSSLAPSATTDTTNASNIASGTLAAARLPNPSASSIGGVRSAAAVAHQWFNSISTTGVPSQTQPAFTDLSGTAADTQLPPDQCTLTTYTIPYNDAALSGVSSATPTKTLLTLPSSSARICLIEISGTTSFAGIPNLTGATVRLQSNAATPLLYTPSQDIFGIVGPSTNNFWTDSGNMADRTAQAVVAAFTFTCSSGNCYALGLTAGSVYITLGVRTMP